MRQAPNTRGSLNDDVFRRYPADTALGVAHFLPGNTVVSLHLRLWNDFQHRAIFQEVDLVTTRRFTQAQANSPALVTTAFAMGGVGVGEGSIVAIKVSRFSGAMVAVGRGVRVGVRVGSRAMPAEPLVTNRSQTKRGRLRPGPRRYSAIAWLARRQPAARY